MRVRPLSATGDYTVGVPYLVNSPAAVAQKIATRLKLWQSEWFADTADGTPWTQDVLGKIAGRNYDAPIQQRILGTPGVTSLISYASQVTAARELTVSGLAQTLYSVTPVPFSVPLNF